MQVLVTGGAGFIGSNFVHYLINNTNHSVITLDALTYSGKKTNLEGVLESPRHKFVEGDVRDKPLVSNLVKKSDAVVNFAAESHVDKSIDNAEKFVKTNVVGTQTLLDEVRCHSVERFIQISTDEVYGQILDGSFTESDSLNPRNPYAATKAGADMLANSYMVTHDIPLIIARPCNNFGPRQNQEKLIPKFIINAASGNSLPVYGDGKNVREWMYVKDNCRAIEKLLTDGETGEIYNIGTGIELSNIEMTKKIINAVGASRDQIQFVEDRPGHDQRYALKTSKIESLGWEPEWSFESALEQTIDYYLANGDITDEPNTVRE